MAAIALDFAFSVWGELTESTWIAETTYSALTLVCVLVRRYPAFLLESRYHMNDPIALIDFLAFSSLIVVLWG